MCELLLATAKTLAATSKLATMRVLALILLLLCVSSQWGKIFCWRLSTKPRCQN